MWSWLQANEVPIQTLASIAQIIGFVFVIFGLWATAKQVRYAASQAQGTTVQETANASRELLMKIWDDQDLRPIVDPNVQSADLARVDAYLGVLIQHYATIFRQWRLGNIPADYWTEVKRDAAEFFKGPAVKKKWHQVKGFYREDFRDFVDNRASRKQEEPK